MATAWTPRAKLQSASRSLRARAAISLFHIVERGVEGLKEHAAPAGVREVMGGAQAQERPGAIGVRRHGDEPFRGGRLAAG